jgi:DNA-binding response OmpR family regulator
LTRSQITNAMSSAAPLKILVVDDDPYILMSLEFLMKKNGFDVLVARNGTEALDIIKEQLPSIVLLDIMMPDVDGYQICAYIKSQTILNHCKVIFLSAKSSEADIQKGLDLGASLYITKPFSTRELVKQVKQLTADA